VEEKLLKLIDWILILFYLIIVIFVIGMALLRYLFSMGLMGGSEINRFLFIFTSCLGTGVLLRRNEHIKLDVVLNLMSIKMRKLIIISNNLIIAILHSYLIYLSINWINKTGMVSSDFFRFPIKYVQIGLPIGFLLVIFFALSNVFDIILNRRNKWELH